MTDEDIDELGGEIRGSNISTNSTSIINNNINIHKENELPKADYADVGHPIFEALKVRFNKKEDEPITYEDLQLYLLEAGQLTKAEYKDRTTRVT